MAESTRSTPKPLREGSVRKGGKNPLPKNLPPPPPPPKQPKQSNKES